MEMRPTLADAQWFCFTGRHEGGMWLRDGRKFNGHVYDMT